MNNIAIIVFLYSILAYSISNMFVFAIGPFHIFEKIREFVSSKSEMLAELFSCMICFPANVGWVLSLLNLLILPNTPLTPFNALLYGQGLPIIIVLCDLFYTSGIVWLIHSLQEYLETASDYEY